LPARCGPGRVATYAFLSWNFQNLDVASAFWRRRIRIIQDTLGIAPDIDIRLDGDREEKEADRYEKWFEHDNPPVVARLRSY
jgi:hypothetical protein